MSTEKRYLRSHCIAAFVSVAVGALLGLLIWIEPPVPPPEEAWDDLNFFIPTISAIMLGSFLAALATGGFVCYMFLGFVCVQILYTAFYWPSEPGPIILPMPLSIIIFYGCPFIFCAAVGLAIRAVLGFKFWLFVP
jgi:hypothetical protein